MGFSIREIAAERKFCQEVTLAAIQDAVSQQTVETVLTAHAAHAQRERKLTLASVGWIVIAMNL